MNQERRLSSFSARCGVILAIALASSSSVLGQIPVDEYRDPWRRWDADFDEGKKAWREIEAKIPPYPAMEHLLRFDAGAASPHRFYLDPRSLSIGDDGVVRYTLVIRTAGGATNVSFEGIRCEERQQRYYATGRPDGTWARARDSGWRRIELREVNRHHNVLYQDFFCSGEPRRYPVKDVREILARLRERPIEAW